MKCFLSKATAALKPYTPGEQPTGRQYIKLNTNENPYPPATAVKEAISAFDAKDLRLYPDPNAGLLREAIANLYNLKPENVFAGGGSDEVLGFAFMAFFDKGDKVYFPDITYGFYKVYSDLFALNAVEIPLSEDFTVNVGDYFGLDGHIFLANPNAPTGICLEPHEIEEILKHNPDRLLILDEAYIDFADGKSCVGLTQKYENLLVVQTFSKSRGLAGMRLGAGFASSGIIDGLERIKYSFNPYNLDRVSMAAGIAAVSDNAYMHETVRKITGTRERVVKELIRLGFAVLPSQTNFLFAKTNRKSGHELYEELKHAGILVRHFEKPRIDGFIRLTIGTDEEMDIFLAKLEDIL